MKILCNKTTKKIEGFIRFGDFNFDPLTHVSLVVTDFPDSATMRLNDNEDDLRPVTQVELDAISDAEKDKTVSAELGTDAIRIVMETLIPLINPSLNVTDIISQAKAIRKAEL